MEKRNREYLLNIFPIAHLLGMPQKQKISYNLMTSVNLAKVPPLSNLTIGFELQS